MSIHKNLKELPAFDIFLDLFFLVLNWKWEGENIIKGKPGPIEKENLSLLLAWPGILMIHLSQITGDTTYQNCLNELKGMLDDDTDSNQIRAFLDTIIESKKNKNYDAHENSRKKIHLYSRRFSANLFLLLNPKSLSYESNTIGFLLVQSLSNYYVLCQMIIRYLERNDGDTYITNREMDEGYFNCGSQKEPTVYSFSRLFFLSLESAIDLKTHNFSKFSQENKDLELLIFSKICTPSIKMSFHRILPENTLAYIKEFEVDSDKLNLDRNINGIGFNISKNLGYDNDLWRLISFKNPKSNGYLFFNEKNDLQDVLLALIKELFKSAGHSALAAKLINTSWDNFLKDPNEIIEEKLEKFDDWIFSLIKDYETRDEFFKFKAFSRIIGDLDTDLDYEIVKEVRNEYKEAKKYHIPMELRQKLLEAKAELDLFVGLVIITPIVFEEAEVLNYFDENRSKYTYLDLLEHDDIKKIKFSTEGNASRDNRRNILPIINKKLGGKNIEGSTLTKLLGLESGNEKYLKYSK